MTANLPTPNVCPWCLAEFPYFEWLLHVPLCYDRHNLKESKPNSPTPNQGELEQHKPSDQMTDLERRVEQMMNGDYTDGLPPWCRVASFITAQVQEAEARGRRKFAQKLASSNNWRVDLEAALGDIHE